MSPRSDPHTCPDCAQTFTSVRVARQHRPGKVCRDPATVGLTRDWGRRMWTWPQPTSGVAS